MTFTTAPLRYVAVIDPWKSEVSSLPDDLDVGFIPMDSVGYGEPLYAAEVRSLGDVRDGYTYLRDGDCTFAKISPSFQNRKGGRAADLPSGIAFATTELTVVRPLAGVDGRFLQYVLSSEDFIQKGAATLHGVAGQQRVGSGFVSGYGVPLPSLGVQRRVADMLDVETASIDQLITKNKQVINTLDVRLQALVDATFTPYLATSMPLAYGALVLTSGVNKHSVEGERTVRLCNYTDVYYSREVADSTDFMIATCSETEYDRLRLLPGDVVMTKDSETADDIAIPAIVRVEDEDLVLGYHNALLRVLDDRLQPDWLYWFLQTRVARDHFALKARGVTRVGLRVEDMAALQVPTVDHKRQIAATQRLWEAEAKTRRLTRMVERQIELLELRRRSLITAAVTGQITV